MLWAHVFGTRPGNMVTFTLTAPAGDILSETVPLEKIQARAMRAIGKRADHANWPVGTYIGTTTYLRDTTILGTKTLTLTVIP